MLNAADIMSRLSAYARPGYWNDPDLLLSVDYGGRLRMSELQSRAQFSLWSVLSAPLLISGSLSAMSPFTLATYSNAGAIRINQEGGVQGSRLAGSNLATCVGKAVANCTNVWGKNTSSASWAVLLLNAGGDPAPVGCNKTCLGGLGLGADSLPLLVTDVWANTTSVLTELDLTAATLPAGGGHVLLTLAPKHP